MTFLPLFFIKIYQKTISPDHGWFKSLFPHGFCRFQPSCSQYGMDAIGKHGLFKGGFMTTWRVLRCNPFSRGGHDPVK
ncbi:membrane protein insertion efficiency factor YidD [Patescibacteria group bacterium]|nr:membrane protein insertion efficiency factor YidD [Patescibacteria group bacterium]